MNNISKYSDLLPKIILHICGVKTEALIDSGASHSFISSELLSTLKIKSSISEELTLLIADGSKVKTQSHIILDVKLGSNQTLIQKFHVLDRITHSIILGCDLLRKLSMTVTFSKLEGMLVLYDTNRPICEGQLQIYEHVEHQSKPDLASLLESYEEKVDSSQPIKGFSALIELKSEKVPICKPYRILPCLMDAFNTTLDDLIAKDFVRRSDSEYCSPSFLGPKSNGKWNLIVDFTELNNITNPLQLHFPDLKEEFHKFCQSKWFTKLDLVQGYYHLLFLM
ncbi:putative retrotransposon protein [Pseudoloma neurophilia]|uniref:Putative retrotransposon protein n=1 Tax=Pseudoloma neurophilia TaxID=146866 RepID=A0A0R0LZP8_9MICR|nr:putative retrotransposon protein [Pseudoloma neurophilia]